MKEGKGMKIRHMILAVCLLLSLTVGAAAAEETPAYVTLTEDTTLSLNGERITVDLAGYDLTVTGEGTVSVFDTANDTYDEAACGTVTCGDGITVTNHFRAPNGGLYIALTEAGVTTAHRLTMELTHVTLRTAGAGLYYKATYQCDGMLAEKVSSYGVVLSLHNMPGADFRTEEKAGNVNAWTVAAEPFQSGTAVTSGSVVNILNDSRTAERNSDYSGRKIYANVYVEVDGQVIVADEENAGKTTADAAFTGTALSLQDVMTLADGIYDGYSAGERLQLDAFHDRWKGNGLNDTYAQIGTAESAVNENLVFDPGTADAVCPVCEKKVTWILLDQESFGDGYGIIQSNGEHICLTEDITYSGNTNFISAPTSGSKTACLHLNGHSITSEKHRAVAGSAGILNVMGNGTVIGNYKDSSYAAYGAVVNINTNGAKGELNLYGGTYATLDGNTQKTLISLGNNGGKLRIYEGAKVIADGAAVTVGTANLAPAELTLCGRISGSVSAAGANLSKGFSSTVNLDGCLVSGGIEMGKNNAITLSGAPVIGGNGLQLATGATVTLGTLTEGASIPVQAVGAFTAYSENARAYEGYFRAMDQEAEIGSQDGILYCATGYQKRLVLDASANGYCPVCDRTVQWTALTSTATTLVKDTHYYLPSDLTYTDTSAAYLTGATTAAGKGTVCLHLNGYNMTAAQYRAINLARTQLNIMGLGVISGNCKNSNPLGATIYSGYSDGKLQVYSGSIKKDAANTDVTLVNYKGAVVLEADAVVAGGCKLAKALTDTAALTCSGKLTGTTIVNGGKLTLSGAPEIENLKLAEGALITLGELTDGAAINVDASGCFTEANNQVGQYVKYFKAVAKDMIVTVQVNALHCVTSNTEDDTLYILTAAASNSHYFTDELYGVLAAAGIKAKVCNLMKDSTGINALYNYWKNGEKVFQLIIHDENGKTVIPNMGLDDALAYYNWDVFNMQEGTAPHRTTTPETGTSTTTPQTVADDRRVAHTALIAHIRETIPNAKLYYQEIWSYDIGFNKFNYQMTSKEQQLRFSASIKEYTDIVCEEFALATIPCGQAWIIARESELAQKMCARLSVNNGEGDYYHDGDIGGGQYLNACVWFETLTGESCIGNTFRPVYKDSAGNTYTLSEELITLLQQAAHQAVANMK